MEKKYLNIIKNYYNINIIFTVKLIFFKNITYNFYV